jgi:hypothetical protein
MAESAIDAASPDSDENLDVLEPTGPIAEPPIPPEAATPPPTLADIDPDAPGVPYAEWKARELNRIFAEHGSGGAGRITAATVTDGLMKAANRNPASPEAHHPDLPFNDRCARLRRVIESHFERSYEAWERSRRMRPSMPRHADFPTFAASWLSANGDRTDGPFEDLGPVVEELRKEFPPPKTPRIARGKTYWGSA